MTHALQNLRKDLCFTWNCYTFDDKCSVWQPWICDPFKLKFCLVLIQSERIYLLIQLLKSDLKLPLLLNVKQNSRSVNTLHMESVGFWLQPLRFVRNRTSASAVESSTFCLKQVFLRFGIKLLEFCFSRMRRVFHVSFLFGVYLLLWLQPKDCTRSFKFSSTFESTLQLFLMKTPHNSSNLNLLHLWKCTNTCILCTAYCICTV